MVENGAGRARVLLAMADSYSPEERERDRELELRHAGPRMSLIEDVLGTERLNMLSLAQAPRRWRGLYRVLPAVVAVALETFRQRRSYDVVVTWHPRVSLVYALLQALTRDSHPHVGVLYWLSKPVTRWSLTLVGHTFARVVTWVPGQAEFAVRRLGFGPERIVVTGRYVDDVFWRREHATAAADPTLVVSAGREMRDYPTLVSAVAGLPVRCVIAGPPQRVTRGLWSTEGEQATEGPNVTRTLADLAGMRELYAESSLVVVPVLPSDTDNGISVIMEAMAMGLPVVATANPALADVLADGENCVLVPPGDVRRMREAIERLLADRHLALRLGEAGRRFIVEQHSVATFAASLRAVADEAAAEHAARA